MAASEDNEPEFNPRRSLCPDGSCIGIIGSDGRCTVCGCAAPLGAAPPDALAGDSDDLDGADLELSDEATDEAFHEASDEASDEASGFDPNRRLCGDDACIGVIGADNLCTECGKPADG